MHGLVKLHQLSWIQFSHRHVQIYREVLIMIKNWKLLVLLSTLYGCVSISKVETSHLSASKTIDLIATQKFSFFLVSNNANKCIRTDQRIFLESAILKYFNFDKDEKINIYFEENFNISPVQAVANTVVSILTYTVIPVYNSITYVIDVERVRDGKSEFWSVQVVNESLGSVLALPFSYNRSNKSVIRNNIENAFYQISFTESKSVGFSSKYLTPGLSAECGSIREELGAQRW